MLRCWLFGVGCWLFVFWLFFVGRLFVRLLLIVVCG